MQGFAKHLITFATILINSIREQKFSIFYHSESLELLPLSSQLCYGTHYIWLLNINTLFLLILIHDISSHPDATPYD